MNERVPDDKIQTVVGLVLQAVDQRLTTVREQLVQITNSVTRSHADLEAQIAEVRELCLSATDPANHLAPGADAAATRQLVDAANVLTDRVTFLEARVNQYTNDRVAELNVAIERLTTQLDTDSGRMATPALSRTVPSTSADPPPPSRSVAPAPMPTPTVTTDDSNIAPAAARLAPLAATASQQPRRAAQTAPVDLEQLSAQMSERLSAAIERALGT